MSNFTKLMTQAAAGNAGGGVDGSLLHILDNPNAYDTSVNDRFSSFAVDISKSYAIVGAALEDDVFGTNSGKAYIFNISDGSLLHTLDNPNPYGTVENDQFGRSVAISESYAIVRSREDDASGDDSGKVYIFDPSTGSLLHTLDNPNPYGTSAGDSFGSSVDISESYVIVGASGEDDAGGTTSGKAYIFNPSTGALLHTLDNPNAYGTSANDYFGTSVSISESYAIVGAFLEDEDAFSEAAGDAAGKAYIFDPSTGSLLHTLDNPNAYFRGEDDNFGLAVSISESHAIVGAPYEDDGFNNSGKAYIFDPSTGSLLHTLNNPNVYGTRDNDRFGRSVAISESYAIVGAPEEDSASGKSTGVAYIFDTSDGSLLYTLEHPYGTSAYDNFGLAVSISESHAIVGAPSADDAGGYSSGKAYIYN
jgi:hypothetical protein